MGNRLPTAYQEVEYIQSSGQTQYIDTGVYSKDITSAEVKFNLTNSNNYTGFGDTATSTSSCYPASMWCETSSIKWYYQGGTISLGQRNTDITATLPFPTQNAGSTVHIFHANGAVTDKCASGKYYYVKLLNGSNVVFNVVPCYRKLDSVAGMYDLVNDVFYTNSGTGTFTVGPEVYDYIETYYDNYISVAPSLPESYQEVTYLQSSGTQYIKTNYILNSTDIIKFKTNIYSLANTWQGFTGCRVEYNKPDDLWFGCSDTGILTAAISGGVYSLKNSSIINTDLDIEVKLNDYIKLNGVSTSINHDFTGATRGLNIFSTPEKDQVSPFTISENKYPANARFYDYKIYNSSNNLVCNLVPCYRKSDSVAGMYDLCNSGKNLFESANKKYDGYTIIGGSGQKQSSSNRCINVLGWLDPGNYIICSTTNTIGVKLHKYSEEGTDSSFSGWIEGIDLPESTQSGNLYCKSFTLTERCYCRGVNTASLDNTGNIMLIKGTTLPTSYEPYPFYTNQGTGSFVVGPDVTPTVEVQTYKEYYVVEPERNLPVGYTELEYIQSSGTQYIDTDYKITTANYNKLKMNVVLNIIQSGSSVWWPVLGIGGGNPSWYVGFNGSNIVYYGNIVSDVSTKYTASKNTFYNYDLDYKALKFTLSDENGAPLVNKNITTVGTPSSNNYAMVLFGAVQVGGGVRCHHMAIKSYQLWDDGSLVRNFIPCIKDSNSEVGMYDKVTNTFYGNSGTGTFTAGPLVKLPDEYQEVTYLQSSGEQYIDTGLHITTNYTKIKAKITPLDWDGSNPNRRGWGVQGSPDNCFCAWDNSDYGSGGTHPDGWLALGNSWYFNKTSSTFFNTTLGQPYEMDFTADNGTAVGSYAGESFNASYGGTLINNSRSIYLFDCNAHYAHVPTSSKIYYFELETAEGSRKFIPCYRKQDNKPGMYDLVTKQFYTNANTSATTDFTVGADVANIIEVYECFYIS